MPTSDSLRITMACGTARERDGESSESCTTPSAPINSYFSLEQLLPELWQLIFDYVVDGPELQHGALPHHTGLMAREDPTAAFHKRVALRVTLLRDMLLVSKIWLLQPEWRCTEMLS